MNEKPRNLKPASHRNDRDLAREVALIRAILEDERVSRDRREAALMLWTIALGIGGLVYSLSTLIGLPFRLSPELAIGVVGFIAVVSLILAFAFLQRLSLWRARERDLLEVAMLDKEGSSLSTRNGS